jgi:rSAM/selenodomain-associated transferase 2
VTDRSQTLLSVIIPTLNEAEHLPALLRDLAAQRHLSLEIIIGDGGSTDATRTAAEEYGALFVGTRRGRAAQMNAAARQATGDFLLFLHADTSIDDPDLLCNALHAISSGPSHSRVAGHFPLRFVRASDRNALAYRYAEEKTAFNRVNTTNGDQGLLLSTDFFRYLGGFDERLPFLEDQRIAEKIRAEGTWITLPGHLNTSARRFEAEGFHRRYILMSMMMGLYSIGAEEFFARAPGIYKSQQDTDRLLLSPFFDLIWCLMRNEWGSRGTIRTFYHLGRYIRQNSWQMFFFCDVLLRPLSGSGRYPFLTFHDRLFGPCTNFKLFDAVTGVLCFIWFMGILGPYFRLVEGRQQSE